MASSDPPGLPYSALKLHCQRLNKKHSDFHKFIRDFIDLLIHCQVVFIPLFPRFTIEHSFEMIPYSFHQASTECLLCADRVAYWKEHTLYMEKDVDLNHVSTTY